MTTPARAESAIDGHEHADEAPFHSALFNLGMTIMRVGFGLVFLTNGLVKLPGYPSNKLPPFKGFLITRDDARSILESNIDGHPVGLYRQFFENVVLAHWGIFSALLTATELFVGVALIVGLVTPLAALIGAAFQLNNNFAVIHKGDQWLWEYPVEWMPLLALAFMRAGRYWGLDAKLARRIPRWPIT